MAPVCRPYSQCPTYQFSLSVSRGEDGVVNDNKRDVRGVAHCDNKLFVVCERSDTIEVFELDSKQRTNVTVSGLKMPEDIVSCSETKQLYIADWGSECVWRVSLDGQHVDKWLTSKSTSTTDWSPWSLSLTSRRLLVTSHVKNSLFLFGSDGIQLKHISLFHLAQPLHAVETSHETFIVCLYHSGCQQQVSEVDANGQVIRSFCDLQKLDRPCYVCLDSDGRVLVADSKKDRSVLLLNCRLELERVLFDTKFTEPFVRPQYPWRICYVEQTGQLVVADEDTEKLDVFSIREPF